MSIRTAPPPPEILSQLLSEHALRRPEKAICPAIGDGGVPLDLPLLIGNPTGTLTTADARAWPAWSEWVAVTMGASRKRGVGVEIVRDCLLYPDRATLATWEERWPALVDAMTNVVFEKMGADKKFVRAPLPGEKPPESIAPLLAANPAACWRWIDKGGPSVAVVISPPSQAQWAALTAAVAREGADCVALLEELVTACCKGAGVGARLAEYPGLKLPIENVIVKLAGAGAEARLGEW